MKGTALSDALDELGVDEDNFRVLGLLPLVYVAWADGTLQRAEHSLIHRLAKMNGWLGDEGDCLLSEWLEEPPTEAYVARGLEVLQSLSAQPRLGEDSITALIAYCREIATAAGSLFGNREPVSESETHALEKIAEALGVHGTATWQAIAGAPSADSQAGPPGPPGHLLVGHQLDFERSPLAFLLDAANNYGDIVHFSVGNEEVFLLRRPDHIAQVLQDDGRKYRRGSEYRALETVLGPSVLTTEAQRWQRLRAAAAPAFMPKRIQDFSVTIVEATDRMLERWAGWSEEDQRDFDLAPEMLRLVLEIIGSFICSQDFGDPDAELAGAVREILEQASHAMENPFRHHEASPARRRRFREAKEAFGEAFVEVVSARRTEASKRPHGEPRDLLDGLLRAEPPLTHAELESQVLTFLLAGHETTAVSLTWAFCTLSRHAVAARRVHREVRDKLRSRRPTHRDTRVCTYTNMVIDEVLRLYPPVWSIDREVREDVIIAGYAIPKDAIVMLSPWVTHRSPQVWTNPEGFDPERFTERAHEKRPPGAYFPCGLGAHACMGSGLALLQLRLIIPRILQRFRLDLVPGFQPTREAHLTLRPQHGVRMTLRSP